MVARLSVATAALLGCLAVSGFGWPGAGGRYVGTEYDHGGATVPIDGPQIAVGQAAQSIVRSTDATLRQIAADRSRLRYGGISPRPGPAMLVTYPAPPGILPSPQYRVSVGQATRSQDSFVYYTTAKKTDTNIEDDTSWTSFSFRGPITVQVVPTDVTGITGCLVRPASAHVHPSYRDGTCSFALTRPGNLSVEFLPDVTNPVLHPMLIFANPPEADVPSASDPSVLYFGPGVHDIGSGVRLTDGETVYLAGGAVVRGAFIADGGVHDVVIRGRGILDGSFMDLGNQDANKNQPGMIDIADQSSTNVLVEGITLANAPRFNIRALASHTTIENVKIMDWWYSADGMVGGNASLLENNFIKVNDDSIKLFWGDTVARYNTIWQLENGAPFMISWNIHVDSNTFHVYDNDVIHAENYQIAKSAVFRALHASEGHLSRYLFEDIRVEDAHYRLFDLTLDTNKWYDPALGWGSLDTLIFRNIHADGPFAHAGLIHGADADHQVTNVALQNVSIGNACLSDATAAGLQIDPASTDHISISRSAVGGCR
jgi:hypothetical protein